MARQYWSAAAGGRVRGPCRGVDRDRGEVAKDPIKRTQGQGSTGWRLPGVGYVHLAVGSIETEER